MAGIVALLAFASVGRTPARSAPAGDYAEFPAEVSPPQDGTVNAFYNDANGDGQFGLWIYRRSGTCPSLRVDAPVPLVIGYITPATGTHPVSKLRYCYVLPTDTATKNLDRCLKGSLVIENVRPRGAIIGSYEFTFESGTHRRGRFVADECPITSKEESR